MKSKLVTVKQALSLKEIGFHDEVSYYVIKFANGFDNKLVTLSSTKDYNSHGYMYVSIPTVDEAIDWLRRKYSIVIFNAAEPFISNDIKAIFYSFKVKKCNKHWGWNMRKVIGQSKWSKDPYAMKRQAISIAIKYIKKEKDAKKKKKV